METEVEVVNRRKEALRVRAVAARKARREQRRKIDEANQESGDQDIDEMPVAADGHGIMGVKRLKRGTEGNSESKNK